MLQALHFLLLLLMIIQFINLAVYVMESYAKLLKSIIDKLIRGLLSILRFELIK